MNSASDFFLLKADTTRQLWVMQVFKALELRHAGRFRRNLEIINGLSKFQRTAGESKVRNESRTSCSSLQTTQILGQQTKGKPIPL